jgi:hypothetical protein
MKSIFVIRNQHDLYLSKQQEWIEGREAASLYRTPHRDEAVNAVFEASLRDISIRAEVVACRLDERNLPRVDERAPATAASDSAAASGELAEAPEVVEAMAEETTSGEPPASAH